jgi:hypothetical protein
MNSSTASRLSIVREQMRAAPMHRAAAGQLDAFAVK